MQGGKGNLGTGVFSASQTEWAAAGSNSSYWKKGTLYLNLTTNVQVSSTSFTGTQSTTSPSGNGEAVNILPPYEVAYCWKRVA